MTGVLRESKVLLLYLNIKTSMTVPHGPVESRREFDMKALKFFSVVAILGFIVACAPQGAQPNSEIAATSGEWQETLNSGDIEGLVGYYTDDCQLLAPNGAMGAGKDAVRTVFGGMISAGLRGETVVVEATSAGDLGYKLGTYSIAAPDGTVVDRGKFIETFRKTADGWKISNDIWNSDLPVPFSGTVVSIAHEVKDPGTWLAAWSASGNRQQMFADNGCGAVRVFQSPENPKQMSLLVEVHDMDEFMTWLNSPASAAAKAEDGVIDSTLKFHAEVK